MRTGYDKESEANNLLAFTRVESLVVLAVAVLLPVLVLPTLASNRSRSDRTVCANNLRQIGIAMQLWGGDHGDLPPHQVFAADGGTRAHPLAANTWLHFSWVSNELTTARVLFCPSDSGRPAETFSGDPNEGYLHPYFRNRATSYFLTYHYNYPPLPHRPMAGDYNVRMDGIAGDSFFNVAAFVFVKPISQTFGWTNGLHEQSGNLLFFDGQVEQANNQRLREAAEGGSDPSSASGSRMRFCIPR